MTSWKDIDGKTPSGVPLVVFVPELVGTDEGPVMIAFVQDGRCWSPHDCEHGRLYYKPSHWDHAPAPPLAFVS